MFFNTIHKQFLKAVQTNQQEEALRLLAKNPDVNFQNHYGDFPLLWAAKNGNRPLTEAILHAQADINLLNKTGNTALLMAIANNHTEIALFLIGKGADIRLTARQDQYGPMHAACGFGNIEVLRALVDNGANLETRMADGKTPLLLACNYGHQEIAEYLIQQGADVNAVDHDGNTPLISAAKAFPGIVQLLLQNGADTLARNQAGKHASAVALEHDRIDIMEMIKNNNLEKAADFKENQKAHKQEELKASGKQATSEWLENRIGQKVEFMVNKHTIQGDYDSRDEGEVTYTGVIAKNKSRYSVVTDDHGTHTLENLPKYCELNTQVLTWKFMTKGHVSYTHSIKLLS